MGVVAGMRSMAAPALVSGHFARTEPAALLSSPLRWLGSPRTAIVLKMLALGEVGADKLPGIAARIDLGPLGARAVSGGLCGAAICAAAGRPALAGAGAGIVAAVASSFGFYHLRRSLGRHLPDPVLAVAEDTLALALGRISLRSGAAD